MVNLADIMDLCYELTTMAFPGCKRRCKLPSPQPAKRVAVQGRRGDCAQAGVPNHGVAMQGMCRDDMDPSMDLRTTDTLQVLTGTSHSSWPCVVSPFCCGSTCTRKQLHPSTKNAVIPTHIIPLGNSLTSQQPGPPRVPHRPCTARNQPSQLHLDSSHTQMRQPDVAMYQPFVLTAEQQPASNVLVSAGARTQGVVQEARQHVRLNSIELQTLHSHADIPVACQPGQSCQQMPNCWYPGLVESKMSPAGGSDDEQQWCSFTGEASELHSRGADFRLRDEFQGPGVGGSACTERNVWSAAAAAEVQRGWAKSNTCSPQAQVYDQRLGAADYERGGRGRSCAADYERDGRGRSCVATARCWGANGGSVDFDAVQSSGSAFTSSAACRSDRTPDAVPVGAPVSMAQLQSRLADLQKSLSVLPRSPAFMPQRHDRILDSARDSTSTREIVERALQDTARIDELSSQSPVLGTKKNATQDSCSSFELTRAQTALMACQGGAGAGGGGKKKKVLQSVDTNRLDGTWQRNGQNAVLAACGHNPDGYCECSQCAALAWSGHGKEGEDVLSRVRRELGELEQEEGDGAFGMSSSPHGLSTKHGQEANLRREMRPDSGNAPTGSVHGVHNNMQGDLMTLPDTDERPSVRCNTSQLLRLRQDRMCNKAEYLLPHRVEPAPVVKLGSSHTAAAATAQKGSGQGASNFWAVSSLLGQSIRLSQSWSIGTKVHHSSKVPPCEGPNVNTSMDSSRSVRNSILSWLLPSDEPSSSSSSHRSPNENDVCSHPHGLYQRGWVPIGDGELVGQSAGHPGVLSGALRAAHFDVCSDTSVVDNIRLPRHADLDDVVDRQVAEPQPPRFCDNEGRFVRHDSGTDLCRDQQQHSMLLKHSAELERHQLLRSIHLDGSRDQHTASRSSKQPDLHHIDGQQKKAAHFATAFPSNDITHDPFIVSKALPVKRMGCFRLDRVTKRELLSQPYSKPPVRPLYHQADGIVRAMGKPAANEWRTADQATAVKGGAGMLYRDWNDSDSSEDVSCSSCHHRQPLSDLYSPTLLSTPSMYQDLSCPAALEVANEIMRCMKLPGGIKYSPVSADSPLFLLGVIHEFTAFDVALAATYLQRIVKRPWVLERTLDIVVAPHLQSWDGSRKRQHRQLAIPTEYSSQRSLLSVLQFVSLTLAAKVLGTQVDISTEVLRVHISRSYSLPVALSQAMDVELMCLDALNWQLGPYLQEDGLDWLTALECV